MSGRPRSLTTKKNKEVKKINQKIQFKIDFALFSPEVKNTVFEFIE